MITTKAREKFKNSCWLYHECPGLAVAYSNNNGSTAKRFEICSYQNDFIRPNRGYFRN